MKKIGIIGAGGMAREVDSYAQNEVDFFALTEEYINTEDDRLIDISKPTERQISVPVIAALGAPAVRKVMLDMWPGNQYATVIAPGAHVFSRDIGDGVIVAPGAVVTTDVEVRNHSIINVGATVSHDSRLGEYVTISPGAHIAGGVELGDGVFVGIGATISNEVKVADGVVIGAGAVVMSDVDKSNSVVVGVPAKEVNVNRGWMREV